MGFSLKKAVKSITAPIKKIASVGVAAGAGFVGGGSVGALAGAAKGVIANSKTSKAAPITARYAGQSLVTGGVANIAAGAALAGGKFLLGAGTVPGAASSHFPGGVFAKSPSIMSRLVSFGQSGGLVGNAGNIFKNIGGFAAKGFQAIGANNIFGSKDQGIVPGETLSADQTAQNYSNVGQIVRSGYDKLRADPRLRKGLKDFANEVQNGGGFSGGVDKLKEAFHILPSAQNAPASAPVVIEGPGGAGIDPKIIVLIIGALGAFYLLRSRKA